MLELIFLGLLGFGLAMSGPDFSGAALPDTDVATRESAVEAPLGCAPEDQTPTGKFLTATEVRPILEATESAWIAVRDYNGQDLLYFTHLLAWRCGLWEIRYGLNGAAADQLFAAEPCYPDTAAPAAINAEAHLPYVTLPAGSVATVTVRLLYDDGTEDQVTFERNAVLLP